MAEESQANTVDVEVKVAENVKEGKGDEKEILTNGNIGRPVNETNREEDDEAASDGDFIKVEKELIDIKESSPHPLHPIVEVEEDSRLVNLESNKLIEKKLKDVELQLEAAVRDLKASESEKTLLKSQYDQANEKLETMNKRCDDLEQNYTSQDGFLQEALTAKTTTHKELLEIKDTLNKLSAEFESSQKKVRELEEHCKELELDNKAMKDQLSEAEKSYTLQHGSLQEALTAKDTKHKELLEVQEAFNGLSSDIENSRKRMEELEKELRTSVSEVRKLEELSKHSSSQADLESQRALEFEKMLELAQTNAKESEGQISNLQLELKKLYNKITDYQHVDEALLSTSAELSALQEKMKFSMAHVTDLETKLVTKDDTIHELTQELNLHKSSEEKLQADVLELQNLLVHSKQEIQQKTVNLEEVELKLREQAMEREKIEAELKNEEIKILSLEKELASLADEKVNLENAVQDLNARLSTSEDARSEMESKLDLANKSLSKNNSLLSEALSVKAEFEQKLDSLQQLYDESRTVAETATKRNHELEGLIQASNAAEAIIKEQLTENVTSLTSVEKSNLELEQQLNIAEVKCRDAVKRVGELESSLEAANSRAQELEQQLTIAEADHKATENELKKQNNKISELEKELDIIVGKCAEHEGQATTTHQRSIELEDLVKVTHSKAEDSAKRVNELESLLEAANSHAQELEKLLSSSDAKYRDAETELKKQSSKVSDILAELEAYQTRSTSLEAILQAANEKEKELTEMLHASEKERKKLEDLTNIRGRNLSDAEDMIRVQQSELKSLRANLESVEEDLEASRIREKVLIEKLKFAGEQLKHHNKTVEEVNARNLELKSHHESVVKDSERKLQRATASFKQKESEAEELNGKLKSLEEQAALYKHQAAESAEQVVSLTLDLNTIATRMASLEKTVTELNHKLAEADSNAERTFSENEILVATNTKLREELRAQQLKIDELNELLKSIHAEKEATAEQLSSHAKVIAQLTDENSRGLEVHTERESRLKETESQLLEAIEKIKLKDSETKELNEKLFAFDAQLRTFEEQASESAVAAASQASKLEEAQLNIRELNELIVQLESKSSEYKTENDVLSSEKQNLSQELVTCKAKLTELQLSCDSVIAEKEKFQLQINSIIEENNKQNEISQQARQELESIIEQLEKQLSEHKAKVVSQNDDMEGLKAELSEKSLLHAQLLELEEKLLFAEKTHLQEIENMRSQVAEKDGLLTTKLEEHKSILEEKYSLDQQLTEIKSELDMTHGALKDLKEVDSRKDLERQMSIDQSLSELEAKKQHAIALENQVVELKKKLQEVETQYKEKDNLEISSRDIDFGLQSTTLSKRKHKKQTELEQKPDKKTVAKPSAIVVAEPSGGMAFKFILAVGLISMIVGIILGKRY